MPNRDHLWPTSSHLTITDQQVETWLKEMDNHLLKWKTDIEKENNRLFMKSLMTEQEKKQIGMKRSAGKHIELLSCFRTIAEILSTKISEVTIDDVRKEADLRGIKYDPKDSAWMGSVFRGWSWTGRVKESVHLGSHGRLIRIWKKK